MKPGRESFILYSQSLSFQKNETKNHLVLVGVIKPPVAQIHPHQSVIKACNLPIISVPVSYVFLATVTKSASSTKANPRREIVVFEM